MSGEVAEAEVRLPKGPTAGEQKWTDRELCSTQVIELPTSLGLSSSLTPPECLALTASHRSSGRSLLLSVPNALSAATC